MHLVMVMITILKIFKHFKCREKDNGDHPDKEECSQRGRSALVYNKHVEGSVQCEFNSRIPTPIKFIYIVLTSEFS